MQAKLLHKCEESGFYTRTYLQNASIFLLKNPDRKMFSHVKCVKEARGNLHKYSVNSSGPTEGEDKLCMRVSRVDTIKLVKIRSLSNQVDNMNELLSRVSATTLQAQAELDASSDVDVFTIRERMLFTVQQLRGLRSSLQPQEDDVITFVKADNAQSSLIGPHALGVVNSSACASECTALGEGLKRAVAGKVASFLVQAKDHHGDLRSSGGDAVAVSIAAPDQTMFKARHTTCTYIRGRTLASKALTSKENLSRTNVKNLFRTNIENINVENEKYNS